MNFILQGKINLKCFLFLSIFLFLNAFTKGQTYKWGSVAIGGGGFVSSIITSKTDPGVMYARTDVGGAYRWNASENKWIALHDWVSENETGYLGIDALAIDPSDNSKIYMLAGISYFNSGKTAILKSDDAGTTFTISEVTSQFKTNGNGMGRQNGERLAVDPNSGNVLFCGTRNNGLFKSTNSGTTWSNVTTLGTATANGNGINFVLFDPSSGTKGNITKTIYFGISQLTNNLYKSSDGGITFSSIPGAPSGLMPQRAVLASNNYLFVTYADAEGPWNPKSGQIWKYHTVTGQWTNITPPVITENGNFPFSGISVDPNNPDRIIASTINVYWTQYPGTYGDRFFLSTDGGNTWRDLVGNGITLNANGCTWIPGQSIHWAGSIEFNPFNPNQAWVTSGNGVFFCDNINAVKTTWRFNAMGIEETVPLDLISIPDGPLMSVIGDYDGFKHTDILNYAPQHKPITGTSTGIAYASKNTDYLVRVGNKMFYSLNQGTTWTETSINGRKGKVAVSANASVILHAPEESSVTYRSVNNGTSWTTASGLNITDAVPVADQVNNLKFYAYNPITGALMASSDGGINFTPAGNAGTGGSKIIRTVPEQEGHLWVALNWGGLTRSVNSGLTFSKITGVTYCGAVGLGKAAFGSNYETIYIWGTVNNITGIHRSADQGLTWIRINDDEHEYGGPGNGQFVIGDMNVFGRVYMSTAGRGIAFGEPGAITTSITTDVMEDGKVNLYPNPVQSTFSINNIPDFKYTVTDLVGNIVLTGNAGPDVKIGEGLRSGVYLVKTESELGSVSLKFIKK